MKKASTSLIILTTLLIGGCNLTFDPETVLQDFRIISDQPVNKDPGRGQYEAQTVEEYSLKFNFSNEISPELVMDEVYKHITQLNTNLSYQEFPIEQLVSVPGSDLVYYGLKGLVVHPYNNLPTAHSKQAIFSPIDGERLYIFEYRDGRQANMEKFKSLKNIRVWQFEVSLGLIEQHSTYNTFEARIRPHAHYIGQQQDVVYEKAFGLSEAYKDVYKRIESALNTTIIQPYTTNGEKKLNTDDVTAFANIQRRYSDSYERKLSTNDKTASEKYGRVKIDDSMIEFKLYPYRNKSVVQYQIEMPYVYRPSIGKPTEFEASQFSKPLNKFVGVLNL